MVSLPSQMRNINELQKLAQQGFIKKKGIKRIYRRKYDGRVYDLCVSQTNCYILNDSFSSNSIGGCLVAYLLRIHTVDPIRWGLSFDRFLSPSRGGLMLKVVM